MSLEHDAFMRLAIAEAELARGSTGDNPWVGAVIVGDAGEILGRGHTRGPGEDHAEIGALRDAASRGFEVRGATMYSTLEPCSFHGRTPACSRVVAERGITRLVFAMRDPNPRVDGEGARMLRDARVEVVEGVCEHAVRRQLGPWVLAYHPHELRRRARALAVALAEREVAARLVELYAIEDSVAADIARSAAGCRRTC